MPWSNTLAQDSRATEIEARRDGGILGAEAFVSTITFYCAEIFPDMRESTIAAWRAWQKRNQGVLDLAYASRNLEIKSECAEQSLENCEEVYRKELELVMEEQGAELVVRMEEFTPDMKRYKCENILPLIDSGEFDPGQE